MRKDRNEPTTLTETPCNNLALRQTARHVSQIYDRYMAEVGLRGTQYSILSKLDRLGPMPIGKLADALVMERTALTRAIGPLQRDGLIKVGDGPDGRTRSVMLTTAGEIRFKAAQAQWRKAQRDFETAFGTSNAETLRATLRRLIAATS